MKLPLLIFALFTTLIIEGQSFREQIASMYRFMDNYNYNGFDNFSNGYEKINLPSRYTSYKNQHCSDISETWKNGDSVVCFYNGEMHISTQLFFKYNNGWKKNSKIEYKYDLSGYPQKAQTYKWRDAEKQFVLVGEKVYSIDTVNHTVIIEKKYQNTNDPTWRFAPKDIYLCDSYGNDTLHIKPKWDEDANDYIDDYREFRHYDAARHLTYSNIQGYEKKDGKWHDSWIKHYYYDKAGNEIVSDEQGYDKDKKGMGFIDSTFYDAQERPMAERLYVYQPKDSSIWMEYTHKWDYENTNSPKDYTETQWRRNRSTDTLSLWSKEVRLYDSDTNLISRYTMQYNYIKGWWVTNHDSSLYDRSDNILYHLQLNNHMMPEHSSFGGTQTFYYYLPYTIAGVESEDGESSISIYPNPTRNKETNLRYVALGNTNITISITDQAGRSVSSETREAQEGENTFLISHPELSAGVYQVEITDTHSGSHSLMKWIIE